MVKYELRLNYINGQFEEVFINSDGHAIVDTPQGLLIVDGFVYGYNNYDGVIENKRFIVSAKSVDVNQEIVTKDNNLIKTFVEEEGDLYVYIPSIFRIFRNRGYETSLVTETVEGGVTNTHVDLRRPHLYLPNFDINFINGVLISLEEKDYLTKETLESILNYVKINPSTSISMEGELV
ncbi:MAG TPA: hypothetical protein EYG85_08830 [Crocinitomix sp.]|nr:hypothetical protein [Crocinitomix sp.]